jgi:hypothetical protein
LIPPRQPYSVNETRDDQEHDYHRTHATELEPTLAAVCSKLTHPMTAPTTKSPFLLAINGRSPSIKVGAFDGCGPSRRIRHDEMNGIGSPNASLVKTLVFAGGINEISSTTCARIRNRLGFPGFEWCADRIENGAAVISREGRPVTGRVIATDGQRMIAKHSVTFLHGASGPPPPEPCPTQTQQRGSDGAAN